jgi:hypothetical protein
MSPVCHRHNYMIKIKSHFVTFVTMIIHFTKSLLKVRLCHHYVPK